LNDGELASRSYVVGTFCGGVDEGPELGIDETGCAAAISNDSKSPHWSSPLSCPNTLGSVKAGLCSAGETKDANSPHWFVAVAVAAAGAGCTELWYDQEA
jgi:hypothetical protein